MGSKSSDGHSRGLESIMMYDVQARFEEPNFSLIFIGRVLGSGNFL